MRNVLYPIASGLRMHAVAAIEASAASRRRGVEWNNRYTLGKHPLVDGDLARTHARFANRAHGEERYE